MRASIQPNHLRCDYRENPLGVDADSPRLYWRLDSDQIGARQTAYQVLVASTLSALAQDVGDYWDSDRVESAKGVHVPYGGARLNSLTRAWWKVRAWDENGAASQWSAPAYWETGIMRDRDWTSQWIQDILIGGPRTTAPAPFLRKEIQIDAPILRARLVVAALGFYEFRINGAKVGDDLLTPGWSDYRSAVAYRVYDVTSLLREGANALGAIVGDGWYCGNIEGRGRQVFGDRPKLRAQLHVGVEGGRPRIFATDGTWRATFGPILESDLLKGESYDARRDLGGWDQPGYDDSAWRPVEVATVAIRCVGHRGPAVKAGPEVTALLQPIDRVDKHALSASLGEVPRGPRREFLLDFEQNMCGRVRLRLKGAAGETVTIRYGGVKNVNQRAMRPIDHYTFCGDLEGEVWAPTFAVHDFRYVSVEGLDEPPPEGAVSGVPLHLDMPRAGSFHCSDERLNELFAASERAEDAVRKEVAVAGGPIGLAGLEAAYIRPWTDYLRFGDVESLRTRYQAMRDLVESSQPDPRELARSDPAFACAVRILAGAATLLGEADDVERYDRWGSAFRLPSAGPNGAPNWDRQTYTALALYFDLTSGLARINALRALVDDIAKRGLHLRGGFAGARYLLRVLSDNGHLDLAYRLLLDPANGNAVQSAGGWLTSAVAGIDADEARPGYEHVILHPRPGGGLRHARGTVHSIRGDISTHWRVAEGVFTLEAKIPAGVTATAYVPCRPQGEIEATCGARYVRHTPDAAVYDLPAGAFCFKSRS